MAATAVMDASLPTVLHRAEPARAAIVMAHGVMSHAGWLEPLCAALARRGITAAAVDRPGSGRARDDDGVVDPARWVQVLVDACVALRREHERVALLGWCWGARPAIVAAQKVSPSHLVLAAPGLAMAASIRARAAANEATQADPQPLPFGVEEFSDDAAVVERVGGDATIVRMRGGHALVLEDPDAVAAAVEAALTK